MWGSRSPNSAPGTEWWIEDVPVPAADPRAERRRALELARPGRDPRRVLLRYADGLSDLIVVAPRGRFGRAALDRLAAGELVAPDDAPPPLVAPAPPPAWGLGSGAPCAGTPRLVPLDHGGDEASWLTALAVTLRRYDPDHRPVVGTDRGGFTVEPAATLGESTPSPATGHALTGLLFDAPADDGSFADPNQDEDGRDTGTGTEYVPCLAPPFPLAVSVIHDCDHLSSHFSAEIAAQFVRHLVHVHQQVVHHPRTPVDRVELFDEAERARTAALGRPPRLLVTRPASVPEALARMAATEGAASLTYRELD